jgi:hypothetical protein
MPDGPYATWVYVLFAFVDDGPGFDPDSEHQYSIHAHTTSVLIG